MKKVILFLLIIINGYLLQAETTSILPKSMTLEEKLIYKSYLQQVKQIEQSNPPGKNVRDAAEWEEILALCLSWKSYPDILSEIVRNAVNECKVIIFCSDSNSVRNTLMNKGIISDNIIYKKANTNSIWIRDFAPNPAYLNDVDSLILIDWIYNRPRPSDDTLANVIAEIFNVPLYCTSEAPNRLISTGGNFCSDGFGTGFSSELILEENEELTIAEIDTIMKKFLGINRYIKMPVLQYDDIHHIDMHFKLLDEETLLVGEYPEGISDGPQIEANLQYILSNFNSVFGTPYKVVRIPMPPDPFSSKQWPWQGGTYYTYTNSVFLNKTILVPTYFEQYDTTALRIYRDNLSGYNVIGINSLETIPLNGAIHCITKTVSSDDALLISHQELKDADESETSYIVKARIQHRTGIDSAKVYYRLKGETDFKSIDMFSLSSEINIWGAAIPQQQVNSVIEYFIEAKASNGKEISRPITAPNGYWNFSILQRTSVDEDNTISEINFSNIYPNPANSITCIPIITNLNANIELILYNFIGEKVQLIHSGRIDAGKSNFFFDASKLSNGVYFIKLNSNGKEKIQKVLVTK